MEELKGKGKLPDYSPRIINIGSLSAYTASVNRGEYCISKAGVDDVDVRTALVGFSKEMVGIGSTDGIGMEMFTERKEALCEDFA